MNKKEKEQFKKEVVTLLKEKLGENFQIDLQEVLKTNVTLDGVLIKNLTSPTNMVPTLYLNEYYRRFEMGTDMDQIVEQLIATYQNCDTDLNFDITNFTDLDRVRGNIFCKLINRKRNERLLADIPYIPFLDLCIVFYVELFCDKEYRSSILIHNSHQANWNLSTEELSHLAFTNLKAQKKVRIQSLLDVLKESFTDQFESEGISLNEDSFAELMEQSQEDAPDCLFVLTTEQKMNDAVFMTDTVLLKDFASKMNASHLLIIPSSVHELLLLPTTPDISYSQFNQMVQEVNNSEVTEDEILSDHCYLFEESTGTIRMV